MRLFVLDPGKASGWFCVDFTVGGWTGGELPHEQMLDWLDPRHGNDSPLTLWRLDRVVTEAFRIGPQTYQNVSSDAEAWSIKQIGAVEMWCRRLQLPMDRQMPSAMKYDEDGSKLKKLDWWPAMPGVKGEKGHRRAAAKHALKWGVDHRFIDPGVFL
jgi:hypothetical protein